ncbi:cytidine deaminase [Spiroplasma sp. AdecLV25b]|uniref:cytidine deaminase n=1 Tax=Spiroplasma sp. AdecLV25b TaxID=3027162 RepID=UPI0027E090F9|nr:cytidine deaminase [Spiroplasma sp. AdecLV25b]
MKQTVDLQALLKKAKLLQTYAYAPYSLFRVSAIVTLKNGNHITGVNVENAAYSAGICAERNALAQVFAQGYQKNDISYLFLITDSKIIGSPCGVCRQFMIETMPSEAIIYISNKNDNNDIKSIISIVVKDLLPMAFKPNALKGN